MPTFFSLLVMLDPDPASIRVSMAGETAPGSSPPAKRRGPMDSCVLDGCYDGSGKEAVGFEVARSVDRMLAWPLPARLAP
ncbi:hypothetical protein, partial [Inquilinus sp. CAU 1745]|uniref:hypothetical protein n=1 Tax=Inquilinus sp. CAU 1745 TaxID=3140369 RepID=UPI00325B3940